MMYIILMEYSEFLRCFECSAMQEKQKQHNVFGTLHHTKGSFGDSDADLTHSPVMDTTFPCSFAVCCVGLLSLHTSVVTLNIEVTPMPLVTRKPLRTSGPLDLISPV